MPAQGTRCAGDVCYNMFRLASYKARARGRCLGESAGRVASGVTPGDDRTRAHIRERTGIARQILENSLKYGVSLLYIELRPGWSTRTDNVDKLSKACYQLQVPLSTQLPLTPKSTDCRCPAWYERRRNRGKRKDKIKINSMRKAASPAIPLRQCCEYISPPDSNTGSRIMIVSHALSPCHCYTRGSKRTAPIARVLGEPEPTP